MDWSKQNTYVTSYERTHSKQSFRPQLRLYRAARQASSAAQKPLPALRLSQRAVCHAAKAPAALTYISIYDSSYQYKETPADANQRRVSGFSRNSRSQVAPFLRPATAPAEIAGLTSEFRQNFVSSTKFKI